MPFMSPHKANSLVDLLVTVVEAKSCVVSVSHPIRTLRTVVVGASRSAPAV